MLTHMPDTSKSFTYIIHSFTPQIFIEHYGAGYMMCEAQYSVKLWKTLFKSKKKLFTFFCCLSLL